MIVNLNSIFFVVNRYSVNMSCAEEKLPPHYPISPMTRQRIEQIRTLVLH